MSVTALAFAAVYSLASAMPAAGYPGHSGKPGATATCGAFAWWAGTWNYAVPGYDPGVTTVTVSNGGCTLQEEFVDRTAQKAHTTIEYDSATDIWRRVVTDPFRTYRSSGKFTAAGAIAFDETPTDRETYEPVDHDHVRFYGEKSSDGGKSWKVLFDATFTRVKPATGATHRPTREAVLR